MRAVSEQDAIDQIATSLQVSIKAATLGPHDAVIAEYIRHALCGLCNPTGSIAAAYITAVTNNVRRQLGAIWPTVEKSRNRRPSQREQEAEGELHPDPVRRVLESVEDLREIDHVGNGYYAPTPTRLVRLSEATVLVVSGAPTTELRLQVSRAISNSWIARTTCFDDLPEDWRADMARWQSKEGWLGTPPGNLEAWTANYVARARAQLAVSAGDISDFEIYWPLANASRPQAFRWMPVKKLRGPADGAVLCRATDGHSGVRRFWLGTLRHRKAEFVADREYPVRYKDLRRLQYGLDRRQGAPTEVRIRTIGSNVQITLSNLLPPEERRVLIAFGRECSIKPGRFPIRFEFAKTHLQAVLDPIEKLGIKVATEARG